ncbi:MAG TPA: D-2-hydroxyacid dehydrogenase [Thermoanaerobaculia bacterium]|nr:D-2-hydroxyacid dehydrogenase [Thermoanaerobaculia bacterium]
MRITAITSPSFRALDALRRDAPDLDLTVGDSSDALRGRISGSDALLLAPRYGAILTDLWTEVRGVRWIHSLGAGVDTLPFDLLRSSDVVVTNSRGLYADALAEFVLASMLWFAKDLRRLFRNQEAARWEPFKVDRLEGKAVGIIGYGGIGQAAGRRAESLGMRVLPVRRRRELGDPTVDEVIAESDYVVLSTPLTPSTFHLLDRDRLSRMRSEAVLINVSRGAVVDEEALVEALRAHRIRGAALDVFETEPLPPTHPLWSLDNVLISPHSADHTADSHDRAMAFFLENLRRFRQGESLENVVDKDERY